ncbi:hypothetical protein DL767_010702 [Monosporascus sp. MG133]|nr:hypothetical protein DL767_010702 [Monosporascus sp. MG133]
MIDDLRRCDEYIRHPGRKCDGSGIPLSSLNNVNRKKDRFDRAQQAAKELLVEAQQDMQNASSKITKAISRLSRLEKQQTLLRKKASELIRRGVASLKELEEQERFKEEQRQISAAIDAFHKEATHPPQDPTWDGLDFGVIGIGKSSSKGARLP